MSADAERRDAERWDAIVVGSGIGGLTCASLLARLRGMRVLVLERHWRLGGFTHVFSRPGAGPWPIGVHYVGQMAPGEPTRAVMDFVTGGAVDWMTIASPFERFHFPGLTVDQPSDHRAHLDALAERWPRQADAIVRWFAAVEQAYEWFATRALPQRSASTETGRRRTPPELERLTTRQALDATGVREPELRAVLTAQWGNYGLPPGLGAFVAHAIVARHFRDGGWFPACGSESLARAAAAQVVQAGGACRTSQDVERVLVDRGRAIGVRAVHRAGRNAEVRDYLAPLVISDAGARATFSRLLARDTPGVADAVSELDALGTGSSAVQLFVALGAPPERLGVRGENHWMFAGTDHDALYARRDAILHGEAVSAYLSFPSMKQAGAPHATAEIVAPLDHAALAAWRDERWRRRGDAYETLKARMTETLLAFTERHVPGLRALVSATELATPLTVEHFTGHVGGAIYGLPPTPRRFSLACLDVATSVPGLLLTGTDVAAAGVVGAMMGGVATVGHVLGPGGMQRVMAALRGAH